MPAHLVEEVLGGEAVVCRMVEQQPVGGAVEGLDGDFFEVEPSAGVSTLAASATAARQWGM